MNKNDLAKLKVQIDSLEREIARLTTQFGNATGVHKTNLADKLGPLKTRLTKLKNEHSDGKKADDQKSTEKKIDKTTKENKGLTTIKEEKGKELDKKKKDDIKKKNFKTTLDAVVAMFANMAKAPTREDLDGLKNEIDGLIPDLQTEHLKNLYRKRVDERYTKRSEEFRKKEEAEKQGKIDKENYKNTLAAVTAMYANMAKAPTQEDLDGLKNELDAIIPDLGTQNLKNLYRKRVDERYAKRSSEFEKKDTIKRGREAEDVFYDILTMPLQKLKELLANEDREWTPTQKDRLADRIAELEADEVERNKVFTESISTMSDADLQEAIGHSETTDAMKAQLQAEVDKRYEAGQTKIIEGRPADEDEGTLNIDEAGILEVVKDGKWVKYTGPYTKTDENGNKVVIEYVNGIAVDAPTRVGDSKGFGKEYQNKINKKAADLIAANAELRTEVFNLIAAIRGSIGNMDSAENIEELNIIKKEIDDLLADIANKGKGE